MARGVVLPEGGPRRGDAMSVEQRLNADMKTAMRSRDKVALGAIRMARGALKNRAIDAGQELSDAEAFKVLGTLIKQRRESAEAFDAAGRDEDAAKERAEAEVLKRYLPAQLGDDELEAIVREVIAAVGASSPRDMGKVMKPVLAKVGGQADGKRVSGLVKRLLIG